MQRNIPRLLLAGTGSGCGKTTVACAILQALQNRGLKTAAFKCGPDYIDPMFHSRITGTPCTNLDLFFFGPDTVRRLLAEHGEDCDVSLIEGVMGYYDGLGLTDVRAGSFDLARTTESPVVLVLGARGLALSALAVLGGFLNFRPDSRILGVILNHCSPSVYEALSGAIRDRFGGRVRPLGYLPGLPGCVFESRHLGLVTAGELTDLREKLAVLAEQAEKCLDLDGILELAASAPPVRFEPLMLPSYPPVRIAVAQDRAFCFYYADNLRILRDMGAELLPFSPLEDVALPPDIHGLYLGGGYPELHARELSKNRTMRSSVRRALERGLPCIAECGGFMYLTESVDGYPMAGYLPGVCADAGGLRRFGYVTLTAREDNLLCRAGESIRAHEFHRWDCDTPGTAFRAEKPGGRRWDCVVATPQLYAGFPHLHFYSEPRIAENFYRACLREREKNV